VLVYKETVRIVCYSRDTTYLIVDEPKINKSKVAYVSSITVRVSCIRGYLDSYCIQLCIRFMLLVSVYFEVIRMCVVQVYTLRSMGKDHIETMLRNLE
jgi:hypothetical protein